MPYSNSDCLPTDTSKAKREAGWLARADAHVHAYYAFVETFGSMEGYYLNRARRARSIAQQMETPSGRAWIARQNAKNAEWRASR